MSARVEASYSDTTTFYAQALAKIERGQAHDISDARALFALELINTAELARLAEAIKPDVKRYPALDADVFERKVRELTEDTIHRCGDLPALFMHWSTATQ